MFIKNPRVVGPGEVDPDPTLEKQFGSKLDLLTFTHYFFLYIDVQEVLSNFIKKVTI